MILQQETKGFGSGKLVKKVVAIVVWEDRTIPGSLYGLRSNRWYTEIAGFVALHHCSDAADVFNDRSSEVRGEVHVP